MELDRRAYWIWLQHALQAGSSKPRHILESFGSIEDFYRAGPQEWGLLGIFTQRELSAMREYPLQEAQAQLAHCAQMGQTVLTPEDGEYPFLLRQIHNPPAVLYVQGELPDFAEVPAISIVGTRKATLVGKRAAPWSSAAVRWASTQLPTRARCLREERRSACSAAGSIIRI